MKSAVGAPLPRITVAGKWQHAATSGHSGRILRLTPSGSISASGYAPTRFNPGRLLHPGFETLYLALDPVTALFEKRALFGDPYASPPVVLRGPRIDQTVVVEVDVDLRCVIDLTDLGAHSQLATTAQELTGDWIGYQQRGQVGPYTVLTAPTGVALTQRLGWELFHKPDVEGIKVISARVAVTCCLVVFTHKLQRPGSLVWDDRNTGNRESYP